MRSSRIAPFVLFAVCLCSVPAALQAVNKPAAPTNVQADAHSTTQVLVTWKDVSNETLYWIERRSINGSYSIIGTVPANVTSFLASGLISGFPSIFRVRAQNSAGFSPPSAEVAATPNTQPSICINGPGNLCLNNQRFRAEVLWRTGTATSDGQAVPLSFAPDSGLFYFFSSSNIEMLVKVLNACSAPPIPPRYWLFYAATTDVEFVLKVTDTKSGRVKTYFNPLGKPAPPVQDTDAFATCP